MIKSRLLTILLGIILYLPQPVAAAINPFPTFPNIRPNVVFWKMVYAKYSSKHGLIHDSNNLGVIYEVINLADRKIPGNSRKNRRKIKAAKEKYRRILRKLANGRPASSAMEKKVLALFGRHPSKRTLSEAARNVRFQLCLKDRFKQGIIKSGRYLAAMKNIFRSYHLPTDLVYLPHVESSFNYEAYSKFGAAGIWQFIRSTGRRFLTISYTVDERRDPIMATKAAARYLKENYQKLGSWPLALTAYNHGANSMFRAQKKYGAYDKILDNYQNRRFGFASKNFYPEFLAAREISKHFRQYFPDIQMGKAVVTDSILLEKYADINDLASLFNTDTARLKALNPSLRPPVFNGQKYIPKHYRLRLPKGAISKTPAIPAHLYKNSQKRSRFYRVARGDTAGKIARMQRVRLRDLLDFNQLGRRAVIYVGQNLRIPAPGEHRLAKSVPTVKKTILAKAGRRKISRPAANIRPAPKPVKVASKAKKQESGIIAATPPPLAQQPPTPAKMPEAGIDSRLAMLQSHTTDWQDSALAMLSGHETVSEPEQPALDTQPQSLITVSPEVLVGNFQVEKIIIDQPGNKVGVVQVEESETLGHYADWLNIPTQRIRDLNHLPFRRQIRTHQEIKIPLNKIDQKTFEERRYEFHKQIAEDFFAAFKVTGVQNYTVKRGDNIWTITHNELELPLWIMKRYNHDISFENLHPGQKLLFPIVEKLTDQ